MVPKISPFYVHFFELNILPRHNCSKCKVAGCGRHCIPHSSCIQTSVCWDVWNSPRGFMWALTFPRPGAASTRGGEESSLGLGRLGKKSEKGESSYSVSSFLPADIKVSWGLVNAWSSLCGREGPKQHEDYRHLVMGKMVWKGRGRNASAQFPFPGASTPGETVFLWSPDFPWRS